MPIMFYAFFIFERWGRKGPEVGKMAEGKSQPKSSRTSIPSHRLGRRSFFFSLGVDRKIKFRCQRYKQELYVALRSQRPILRDDDLFERLTLPTCRDIRLSWRPRDFISRTIAPPSPRHHAFMVDKLITRNKSERHAGEVIDPWEWGRSGITPRCRRSDCR